MGTWGVKLYDDDIALDIKERFTDPNSRKNVWEITTELMEEYSCILDDVHGAPVFWFTLVDTQWNLGCLLQDVKERALEWLERGGDLAVWAEENPKLAIKRKAVLTELQQKLKSPQPSPKKLKQPRLFRCGWGIGDVFAYQFTSKYSKKKGYYKKYTYFVKIGEKIWYPGHIVPVVRFLETLNHPQSEANALQSIEEIANLYNATVYSTELCAERQVIALLIESNGEIPKKKLTYIGNIKSIMRSDYEKVISKSVGWKYIEIYLIGCLMA